MIRETLAQGRKREYWVMITQCAWCTGIKIGPWYVRIPGVQNVTREISLRMPTWGTVVVSSTHGVCPDCAEKICGHSFRS